MKAFWHAWFKKKKTKEEEEGPMRKNQRMPPAESAAESESPLQTHGYFR